MTYEKFKEELVTELKDIFEEKGLDVEIRNHEYEAPNKTVDGTVMKLKGTDVAPTLHTDNVYMRWQESDWSVRDIAEQIADSLEYEYDKIRDLNFEVKDFTSEFVREHSYLGVVNKETNEEFLSKVPHEDVKGTDLSAYAKINVGDGATITITNEHASYLRMTDSEILNAARDNTMHQDFSVHSMSEALRDMLPSEIVDELEMFPEFEKPNIVMVTNEVGYDGANAILSKDALNEACEKLGTDDITIIPSSRHELLAVNADALGIESTADIKGMVEEINTLQVPVEDQLSDNIYHYNGSTQELEMCNEQGLFPEHSVEELTQEATQEIDSGISMGGN